MKVSAEELYADVIRAALLDEVISADEDSIIKIVADALELPQPRAETLLQTIQSGNDPDIDRSQLLTREMALECFYRAWVAAGSDSAFTEEEMKLLAMLAYALQIDESQRLEVQKRAAEEGPQNTGFATRFAEVSSGVLGRLRIKDPEGKKKGPGLFGRMSSAASAAAGAGRSAGSKVRDGVGEGVGKVKKSQAMKMAKGVASGAAHKAKEAAGGALEKASDLKDAAVEKVKQATTTEESTPSDQQSTPEAGADSPGSEEE